MIRGAAAILAFAEEVSVRAICVAAVIILAFAEDVSVSTKTSVLPERQVRVSPPECQVRASYQ